MNKILFALPLLLAVGCGVSDDTLLSEIDADLWEKICDKATADATETPAFTCDGVDYPAVPATTSADCQADAATFSADCSATFGEWKECADLEFADPCDFEGNLAAATAACGWRADCVAM